MVVNVEQRTSLYRTIDRLAEAGLVAVPDTERDHAYPERTVYEVTDAGREAAREWLVDLLAVPKREFPQFPAALSHLLLLSPEDLEWGGGWGSSVPSGALYLFRLVFKRPTRRRVRSRPGTTRRGSGRAWQGSG
ncbi:PadR family transcriptional regulator [Streptosporangium canum]|uniref:PadR family transcriptional regulator n=1 Tax=Streptosporangium canum TaxID=324952 RepID=UPI003441ACE2